MRDEPDKGAGPGAPDPLDHILHRLPYEIFWKDRSLAYLGCNLKFAITMGLDSPQQLIGKTDSEIMGAEKAALFESTDRQVLELGTSVSLTHETESPDHGKNWAETVKMPMYDPTGRIAGILGISQDVTEQVTNRKALNESEKLRQAIADNAPIGISVRDSSGRLLFANDSWKKIWKMTPEEIRRETQGEGFCLRLDSGETYLGDHWAEVRQVFEKGGEIYIPELEVLPRPKENCAGWLSQRFYAVRDESGNVDKVVILTEDITRQKQHQRAARRSEEQYRALATNIPVGVFRSTPAGEGSMIQANPAMVRMFGCKDTEEMLRTSPAEFYADPEARRRFVEKITTKGSIQDMEFLFRRKDGSTFWGTISARAVGGEGDSYEYLDGTIMDVTARKEAVKRLEESLESLSKTIENTVSAMSLMVDMKDPYTTGHQRQVAELAAAIAESMGLPEESVKCLSTAGQLHDIGKMCVPSEILTKPGPINDMEYTLIRSHPRAGYDILKTIDFPWPVAEVILQHHERMDGSGYPYGLEGEQILLESRILAVADVVDAMASHRPYRPSLGIGLALKEIEYNAGTLFDAEVVKACLALFREQGYKLRSYGPGVNGDIRTEVREN
jgi:PAS domain S-box-containing protein/putative nucleotidyltransferase with HDIG domain